MRRLLCVLALTMLCGCQQPEEHRYRPVMIPVQRPVGQPQPGEVRAQAQWYNERTMPDGSKVIERSVHP